MRPHLADDLDLICLSAEVIAAPPVQLYPAVVAEGVVPADVEFVLLRPLERDHASEGADDAPAI